MTPSSLGSINARDDASAAEFWASQQAGTGTLTATVTNAAGGGPRRSPSPVSVQPDPRGDFVTNDDGVLVEYRGTDPNIRIPEGVTGIGSSFSSIALDSVWVPASVRTIDDRAFYGTGLKEITFQDDDEHPSQLTAIYGEAFSMTAIETLTLPRSVETVLQSFENMGNLTTVRLGPNLGPDQLVGDFRYTPKLTNIEVDPASANYTSDDGVLYTRTTPTSSPTPPRRTPQETTESRREPAPSTTTRSRTRRSPPSRCPPRCARSARRHSRTPASPSSPCPTGFAARAPGPSPTPPT